MQLVDTEFYITLVRHGQSEINAYPDHIGQYPDTKLTALGKEQARLLGNKLERDKLDFVYSSPYDRALDTAIIVNNLNQTPYSEIKLVPELVEYDSGEWLGASRSRTLTPDVRLKMQRLEQGFQPPSGESMNQVERRVSKWLDDELVYNKYINQLSSDRANLGEPPLNIIAFTHGLAIKCLLHYVMGFDRSLTWKIAIDNTSTTKLYFGVKGWEVLCINDCSHLV